MSQEGSGPVVLDPALFADQAAVDQGKAQPLGHAFRDAAVVAMGLLAAPAVEAEVGDGQAAVGVLDEGGAAVPAPEVVGRNVPDLDASAEARGVQAAGAGGREHRHGLVRADRIGDVDDGGLHGGQVAGPVDVDADRPLHQGPQVRGAFGRHLVAARSRGAGGAAGRSGPQGGQPDLDKSSSVHGRGD